MVQPRVSQVQNVMLITTLVLFTAGVLVYQHANDLPTGLMFIYFSTMAWVAAVWFTESPGNLEWPFRQLNKIDPVDYRLAVGLICAPVLMLVSAVWYVTLFVLLSSVSSAAIFALWFVGQKSDAREGFEGLIALTNEMMYVAFLPFALLAGTAYMILA